MSVNKSKYIFLISIAVSLFCPIFNTANGQNGPKKEMKNDCAVISQSIPKEMFAGHSYTVFIRLRNTGTTIWTPDYYTLGLSANNKKENKIRNLDNIKLRSKVNRGSDVTFSFQVKAPEKPGTYNFKFKMKSPEGFFGEAAGPDMVTVNSSPANEISAKGNDNAAADNSALLMQIMTDEMTAGARYEVSVTMQNTGKTSWTRKDKYYLAFQNSLLNIRNNNLKYTKIDLPYNVPPGGEVTFNFTIKAPSAPGNYEYQWQMIRDGVYFGQPGDKYSVSVK
jgi:uncharacterized membrane protein